MKRKIVISMLALLGILTMGCSTKEASIENNITTEVIAEVVSTEEVVEKEEIKEKETEQVQTFDEIEIPYYETYEEFIAVIGLNETEYDLEGMYKYYCFAMELTTPEGAILNCIKNREFFTMKEQAVAKDDKKPSNSSKPSSGSSSSGGVSSSGLPYWEEPVISEEEAMRLLDEYNIANGGMSIEELKNCEVPEYTEEEKKILETIRGY